jgi:alginate O-acetyltransferase complex protein AlgI
MLIIVSTLFLAMKLIVIARSYRETRLSLFQWLAFTFGWFGMRPAIFADLPSTPRIYGPLLLKGISRIIIGIGLLYLSALVGRYHAAWNYFVPQLLLLTGLSFVLHFGILNLSSAFWRRMGVDAPELFRSPFKSKSLKEFWGKRWNVAFSEMTALVAYRPLKPAIGERPAVMVSFLFSGLLHEIAISLPVNAGYGLPMLYFTIHAVAMHLESTSPLIQRIISHRVFSHIWVMTLLILPMPLLFHRPFINEVLIPLSKLMLSAIS